MEEKGKRDAEAEFVLRVSQEDSRPIESEFEQDPALSTVCAIFPVPANNPTDCSDDYKCLQNIKSEHKLAENLHENSADGQMGDPVDDDRIVSSLQSVQCEEQSQELNEQQAIFPFMNTDEVSMLTGDVNELTEVKPQKKTDPGEYGRNTLRLGIGLCVRVVY